MYWYVTKYYVLFVSLTFVTCSSDIALRRLKRWLVYPYGGQVKVVVGVSWPVMLGIKQQMSCSINLQFQFPQAQNVSQIKTWPTVVSGRSRDKRDEETGLSDRMLAYEGVESVLERYGLDGRICLLRSICENAMDPIEHEENGIYGRLLHIFLSPNYGDGEVDPGLDIDYVNAQKAGYYGVDCYSMYPGCPYGEAVLDLISVIW